jgi:hypothetical protein
MERHPRQAAMFSFLSPQTKQLPAPSASQQSNQTRPSPIPRSAWVSLNSIAPAPCSSPGMVRPRINIDAQPTVLWIWDLTTLKQLAVIQQTVPIRSCAWNPLLTDQLAFCTGNGLVYLWERRFGCDAIEVPAGKNLADGSEFQCVRFQVEPRWTKCDGHG